VGDRDGANTRMRDGLDAGKLSFTLRGKKLHGSWTLVRTARDPKDWLLIKHRDSQASTRDVLDEDRSVVSGLTIADLKEGRMPRMASHGRPHADAREAPFPDAKSLRPMLATPVARPFSRPGWLFEPKLDGVRALAFVSGPKPGATARVDLRSRRGNAMNVQYPEVVGAMAEQPSSPRSSTARSSPSTRRARRTSRSCRRASTSLSLPRWNARRRRRPSTTTSSTCCT